MLVRIEGPRVCLTFDDGPDPDFTPAVLEILAARGCRASFFVLGEAAARWPELVRRIACEGHSLGNHTYTHPRGRALDAARARAEIERCQRQIETLCGFRPLWFRPPYGSRNRHLRDAAQRLGLITVLWSRSAIDWGIFGTQRGIARRLRRIAPGDIVLMHDGRRRHNRPAPLLALLPALLDRLRERGIEPVSLDQYAQNPAGHIRQAAHGPLSHTG